METNENEAHSPELLRYSKSGPKREVYSNTGLAREARKISNYLTPKEARKRIINEA